MLNLFLKEARKAEMVPILAIRKGKIAKKSWLNGVIFASLLSLFLLRI